ncbi:MAG: hypothetical protein AAFV90_25970 [Cyanobacteria bacterium J06634_5]
MNEAIGHLLKLLLDVEDITMTRSLWHGRFLPSPQATTAIGNCVVWVEALFYNIQ